MGNTYHIENIKGHYEAYDKNKKFICSGDSWDECYNDLKEIIALEMKTETEELKEVVA